MFNKVISLLVVCALVLAIAYQQSIPAHQAQKANHTTEENMPDLPSKAPSDLGLTIAVIALVVAIAALVVAIEGLDDSEPGIGDISVSIPYQNDWYVGEERQIDIDIEASFGHISGNEKGSITVDVEMEGETLLQETQTYSSNDLGGGHEGIFSFSFKAEGKREGFKYLTIDVTVDGEKDGFLWDSDDSDYKTENVGVDVKFPLKLDPNYSMIAWLNPASVDINHDDCETQTLRINNCSTADGQITEAKINDTKRHYKKIDGKSTIGGSSQLTTLVSDDKIGHEADPHEYDEYFSTYWNMSGTDNIRLFLKKDKEWKYDGQVCDCYNDKPNICRGQQLVYCEQIGEVVQYADPIDINDDFYIALLSPETTEELAPEGWEIKVTDVSDGDPLNATVAVDADGKVNLNYTSFGPLVDIQLVTGSNLTYYEARTMDNLCVELLAAPAALGTFYVVHKEISISGNVQDMYYNPMVADVYAINSGNPGVEVFLGRVRGSFNLGPLNLSTLGYPTTTLKFYADPQDFIEYEPQDAIMTIGGISTASDINLGLVVFTNVGAVELISFSAAQIDGSVCIEWTTATEIDHSGFNIFRSTEKDGEKVQLNSKMIVSKGDNIKGASYSFTDYDITNSATYFYWLEEIDLYGNSSMSGPISVTIDSSDEIDEESIPTTFNLAQNSPNPFNPGTEIRYQLPEYCKVRLDIYDVLGRRVVTLVNEFQAAGTKIVSWDGKDEKGLDAVSGIYFYRLRAGSFANIKKMTLIR